MDYVKLFQNIKTRTGMYLEEESYYEAAAFLYGCDAGNECGLLQGFREWLIVRLDGPNNLAWSGLVLHSAFPDERDRAALPGSREHNQKAIHTLFDLAIEFLGERNKPDGLRLIFERYSDWLRRQPWFQEDTSSA